jgi:hypothetical protein
MLSLASNATGVRVPNPNSPDVITTGARLSNSRKHGCDLGFRLPRAVIDNGTAPGVAPNGRKRAPQASSAGSRAASAGESGDRLPLFFGSVRRQKRARARLFASGVWESICAAAKD